MKGIYLNQKMSKLIKGETIPGRLLMIDCVINGIRIINVYISDSKRGKNAIIQETIFIFTGHHVIVCGEQRQNCKYTF